MIQNAWTELVNVLYPTANCSDLMSMIVVPTPSVTSVGVRISAQKGHLAMLYIKTIYWFGSVKRSAAGEVIVRVTSSLYCAPGESAHVTSSILVMMAMRPAYILSVTLVSATLALEIKGVKSGTTLVQYPGTVDHTPCAKQHLIVKERLFAKKKKKRNMVSVVVRRVLVLWKKTVSTLTAKIVLLFVT